MADPIEEFLQIDVHHPPASFLEVALSREDRVLRAPSRSKAVGVFRESGIELRLQYLQNGLLDETIQHGGDTEQALAPTWFRNCPPPDGFGLVGFREQLRADRHPVSLQVGRQVRNRHTIDAWTAFILLHPLQRAL